MRRYLLPLQEHNFLSRGARWRKLETKAAPSSLNSAPPPLFAPPPRPGPASPAHATPPDPASHRAGAMAAQGIPALARQALGRPPPWAEDFRQQLCSTLHSASKGACGGSAPGSWGTAEEEQRHPANRELTRAERHIAELHRAACAVRPAPACPAASAPARVRPPDPEAGPGPEVLGHWPGPVGLVRPLRRSC